MTLIENFKLTRIISFYEDFEVSKLKYTLFISLIGKTLETALELK